MTRTSVTDLRRADYFGAVHRKIEIAQYHLQHLVVRLQTCPKPTHEGYPPVDVQAHFEGVLFSIKAAVDQVTELISIALNCRFRSALAEGSKAIPNLKSWREDPLFDELNELRRLAAHHTYVKRPLEPEERWTVQEVGSSYKGSRELSAYCRTLVAYGKTLLDLVEPVAQPVLIMKKQQHRGSSKAGKEAGPGQRPLTARDLVLALKQNGLIGMWKDRTDIGDTEEFARLLREQAFKRRKD